MGAFALVCRIAALCLALAPVPASAAEGDQPHPAAIASKAACLNAAETREEIRARRLIEPFAALKYAAQARKAEALSAKLCHIGDDFIYEITLLHRDGQLVHVQMDAASGKLLPHSPPHEAHDTREQPAKNDVPK